jgi:hypothetical protein
MTKSNCWKGLAILGIWVGVGLVGFSSPTQVFGVAMAAMIATVSVALLG